MGYSSYDAIKSVSSLLGGLSNTEFYKDYMQAIINNQFEQASNYYVIKAKDRYTGVFSDLGVLISGWYSQVSSDMGIHDDVKKIIFKDCNQVVNLGDIFEFDNFRWMVISTDNVASVTQSCAVKRCNVQLKFIDSTENVMPTVNSPILTIDGIADVKVYVPLEDRYLLLPTNQMVVNVPNDEVSNKIKDAPRGTRFLLGSPVKGWRVIGMDSITYSRPTMDATPLQTGIMSLKLQSEAINHSVDNINLSIAKQS